MNEPDPSDVSGRAVPRCLAFIIEARRESLLSLTINKSLNSARARDCITAPSIEI